MRAALQAGASVSEVARQHGTSRQTIMRARDAVAATIGIFRESLPFAASCTVLSTKTEAGVLMAGDGGFVGAVRPLDSSASVVPFFIAIGDRKHGPFATIADAAEFASGLASKPQWRVVRGGDTPEASPGRAEVDLDDANVPDAPVRRYRHLDFRTVSTR